MNYDYKRLHDYALWYYFRYYPSDRRLLQKLQEKGNKEDSEKVFQKIEHLLKEDEIIHSKVDNYIYKNKNYNYIRQKMFLKLFPKEKVERYLDIYKASGKSLLDEEFLKKRIEAYIGKGKSRQYIGIKLWETPEDKQKCKDLLDQYFFEGESKNILFQYKKLKKKYPREKIIQKLIGQWFRYDDIKWVINEL